METDQEDLEMNIVITKEGNLVFDDDGRVCLCNKEGTFCYVDKDMLPENFFKDFSSSLNEPECQKDRRQKKKIQKNLQIEEPGVSEPKSPPQEQLHSVDHASEYYYGHYYIDQDHEELDHSEQASVDQIVDNSSSPQIRGTQERQVLNDNSEERPVIEPVYRPPTQEQETPRIGTDERAHWSHRQILCLINAYKDNKDIFESNTIKNSVGWRRISEAVGSHSQKQCEAKFKYLKGLYTKKKDNMGSGSSGARAVTFEYFEEFEEIFRAEPNIVPVRLASSSTLYVQPAPPAAAAATIPGPSGPSAATELGASAAPHTSVRPLKPRRSRLEAHFEKFQKTMEQREKAREKRMEKFIQAQQQCTEKICTMLQKFIDKM